MMNYSLKLLSLALLSCSACSAQPEDEGDAPARSDKAIIEMRKEMTERKDIKRIPPSKSNVVGEVPEDMLTKVKNDLSSKLGHDNMELVRAQAVTWSDGSMGCPNPGMMYTQMLISGYHVILKADGKNWDYRLNQKGGFRLCKNPPKRPSNPGSYTE